MPFRYGKLVRHPYRWRNEDQSVIPPKKQAIQLLDALIKYYNSPSSGIRDERAHVPLFLGVTYSADLRQTQQILGAYLAGETQTGISGGNQTAVMQAMEALLKDDGYYRGYARHIRLIPISTMASGGGPVSDGQVTDCLRNLLCVLEAGCPVFALWDVDAKRFAIGGGTSGYLTPTQNTRIQTLFDHLSQHGTALSLSLPASELSVGEEFSLASWRRFTTGSKRDDIWGVARMQRWHTQLDEEIHRIGLRRGPLESAAAEIAILQELKDELKRIFVTTGDYDAMPPVVESHKSVFAKSVKLVGQQSVPPSSRGLYAATGAHSTAVATFDKLSREIEGHCRKVKEDAHVLATWCHSMRPC